jgi:hypothetical protein
MAATSMAAASMHRSMRRDPDVPGLDAPVLDVPVLDVPVLDVPLDAPIALLDAPDVPIDAPLDTPPDVPTDARCSSGADRDGDGVGRCVRPLSRRCIG